MVSKRPGAAIDGSDMTNRKEVFRDLGLFPCRSLCTSKSQLLLYSAFTVVLLC